jgi:predicted transcriptional regulator
MMAGRYDDLIDRLQVAVDDLDQITFDQLREASAEGKGRPIDDKRLTQARRAIEKAIHLLSGASSVDE